MDIYCMSVSGLTLDNDLRGYIAVAVSQMFLLDTEAITLRDEGEEVGVITRTERDVRCWGMIGSKFTANFGEGKSVHFFVRNPAEVIYLRQKQTNVGQTPSTKNPVRLESGMLSPRSSTEKIH